MRGTFVYDIVTTVGTVLLVFLIIYWSVQYGTDMVANMLLSDPAVIQGALASAASFSCRTYNYTFALTAPTSVPARIIFAESIVRIIPPEGKIRDWTGVERGGYVQFRSIDPSDTIRCNTLNVEEFATDFPKSQAVKFTATKNKTYVSLKVR